MGPVFDGVSFGGVGPYEKVTGRLRGEVDPGHSLNAGIVNLDKAPRNRAGEVEYQVEFCLLKPADMRRHNGRILYDVLNRGNKLAMNAFNDAPARNDLDGAADAGNGFLMRQGFAVLWSAWQGDVAAGEGRMLASFPVASDNGAPIVARNRDEFIFNHTQNPALAPLSYPAHNLDPAQASLTVRQRESDPRVALPGTQWKYRSERSIEIVRPAEFDAGAIYEFIYPARDPIVMGLGFAAMRDGSRSSGARLPTTRAGQIRSASTAPDRRSPACSLSAPRSRDASCATICGRDSTRIWRVGSFSTA